MGKEVDRGPSTRGIRGRRRGRRGGHHLARGGRVPVGDVLLVGAGTATHIHNGNEEGQPALIVAPPEGEGASKGPIWRVKIADFRITGNEKSGHGILARNVNEIFIDGITVSYHGGDGVRLESCYEDPRICDALITYNKGAGIALHGCHDIVVAANQLEENDDAVRCIDGYNLCMTGNNLDDHLGEGVVIENTYGSVVAGNMIEECHGAAIVLDRDCYGITIGANVIAHDAGGGVDLRDAHGCAVSANTFTIVPKRALVIGPGSGRIAVAGNAFSDSFIGEGAVKRGAGDRAASGVILKGTRDIALAGNLFSGLRPKAVALEGPASRRVLFAGNVLADGASDHGALRDSLVGGNLDPEP